MSTSTEHTRVPRAAIIGAAALMALTIALAAAARHGRGSSTLAPPRASILVRFEDRSDGSLVMSDGRTGRALRTLAPQTNGFVRGVLRGMFRSRKLESLPRDASFRLSQLADGSLALEDPETGRRVDLCSFGPSNSSAFADLLVAGLQ